VRGLVKSKTTPYNGSMRVLALGLVAVALLQGSPTVTTIDPEEELPSRGRLGGVSVDAQGSIYVSDFARTVWRVSPAGDVDVLVSSLRGSSGNAVDAKGNLYQASFSDNRIVRVAPDGTVETYVSTGLEGPVGVALDSAGNLYVCNCLGDYIAKVRPDKRVQRFATSADFDCPNGIAVDTNGDLIVASFENGRLVRVSSNGTARAWVDVPEGRNAHVAVAKDAIYVTKIESNRIYQIDRSGKAEPFAGTGEQGLEDGNALDATLSRPNGIALSADGRTLYVNNLEGPWRGTKPTKIHLRRISLGN
jgi:sugar lactone lactonase YvrE